VHTKELRHRIDAEAARIRSAGPGSGRAAGPWLRTFQAPGGRRALVCLPHAGGASGAFRHWQGGTAELDIIGVELPGRAARFTEAPVTRMEPLATDIAAQLSVLDHDYALFGHSLGGLLAFEVARRIRDAAGRPPLALFVAGCLAPDAPAPPPVHDLPRDRLLAWLEDIGGLDPEIARLPDLVEILMPALRADLAVYDTYRHQPAPPLEWPIHVLAGRSDPTATPADLEAWRAHTTGAFTIHALPGDHFFIHRATAQVLRVVEGRLPAAEGAHR
jgi:surfactin synthase thioesterase subunit